MSQEVVRPSCVARVALSAIQCVSDGKCVGVLREGDVAASMGEVPKACLL